MKKRIFIFITLLLNSTSILLSCDDPLNNPKMINSNQLKIKTGADVLLEKYVDLIKGKNVGLITDNDFMPRALWAARKILPTKYQIIPLHTGKFHTYKERFIEKLVLTTWKLDIGLQNIETGDILAFEQYLNTKHPAHAHNTPLSAYKIGIVGMNIIKNHPRALVSTNEFDKVLHHLHCISIQTTKNQLQEQAIIHKRILEANYMFSNEVVLNRQQYTLFRAIHNAIS